MNNFQFVNASKWLYAAIGNFCCYTPNQDILTRFLNDPEARFWEDTFSAFACVIYNQRDNHIVMVRDHFGLEPLFYLQLNNQIIFGSNIPDLLKHIENKPTENNRYIEDYLSGIYTNFCRYSEETHLQDIFRVKSGHLLTITSNNKIESKPYWSLAKHINYVRFADEREYLERFTELLLEGIKLNLVENESLAAEFSGGLDSSCVVNGLHQLGLSPRLYMHVASSDGDEIDDSEYAHEFVKQLGIEEKLVGVSADDFDLLSVVNEISDLFAGGFTYLFPVGANNIHKEISRNKHKIVFSGFGGDECVSGHAPLLIYLRELSVNKNYSKMEEEIKLHFSTQGLRQSNLREKWLFYRNKYQFIDKIVFDYKLNREKAKFKRASIDYKTRSEYLTSISKFESELICGDYSHHVMMRIEESAIVARHYGFKYCYPLLYPPLVEFCNQLPLHFKRNNGENRIMIRNYLSQFFPSAVYSKHQKVGGIMPATVSKMKQEYLSGRYEGILCNPSYDEFTNRLAKIYPNGSHQHLINKIFITALRVAKSS